MRGKKKTYLVKLIPAGFFWEEKRERIEDDLTLDEVISRYISVKEVESPSPDTINFFVVQERVGSRKSETGCHIGEVYTLDRIENEFGKDCPLYRNVVNNHCLCAVRYITGNFGGVEQGNKIFSQQEIIDIISRANKLEDEAVL